MAQLDEKITRIEACVRELAQDREDFDKGKIALQLDTGVVKASARQLDQATTQLTAMLDDWKDVGAKDAECGNERADVAHDDAKV